MPDLESPEQLGCLFHTYLNKNKLQIFQNISKCSENGLRQFKSKNTCELCNIIQDKENRVKIMAKKFFVLHREVIDAFNNKCLINTI